MKVVEIRNLTKRYKRYKKQSGVMGSIKGLFKREYEEKLAVSGVDLEIEEGEFIGLIGPNGAGKTTLIKMLTGIIAPSEGEISVLGYYPNKLQDEFKRKYAVVMGQKSQLFFELTPADTFTMFKELYNINDKDYNYNLNYFIDLFQIKDLLDVQVRTLSLGERMKMELIVALLHNPKVLFLDEPTIGLDAIAQKQIRQFLKDVNEMKGTTIVITSHYMEDIKSLCNRCVVIRSGKKVYDGETDILFKKYQTHKYITVYFEDKVDFILPEYCNLIERDSMKISFSTPKEKANVIIKDLFADYDCKDVTIEEEDIGSVVERIYSERMEK